MLLFGTYFWYSMAMSKISLSVVVPVYNEEKTVAIILEKLLKVKEVAEIIVVDDGSKDKSLSIIKKNKHKKIKVFSKNNGGKGTAIRFGLSKVTGNYVVIQDADLEYDPADIPLLLEPIRNRGVEVVYGSRFLGSHSNLLFWHRAGNAFLNLVVNVLFNTTLSDMETCYKVLPTKLFKEIGITSNSFDMEPEITCKVLKRGVHIFEVPITYVGRGFDEGKKITWKDGFGALYTIFKHRLLA